MVDRIREYQEQAADARRRAAQSGGEFRDQWLHLAEMWEELEKEYVKIRSLPRTGETA